MEDSWSFIIYCLIETSFTRKPRPVIVVPVNFLGGPTIVIEILFFPTKLFMVKFIFWYLVWSTKDNIVGNFAINMPLKYTIKIWLALLESGK